MDLNRDEANLLRLLSISKTGLHIYTVFRRVGIGAPAMAKALSSLQRENLLEVLNDVASLTARGRDLIEKRPLLKFAISERLANRSVAFTTSVHTLDYKGPTIGVNELYVPRTSELPRSLLSSIAKNEEGDVNYD